MTHNSLTKIWEQQRDKAHSPQATLFEYLEHRKKERQHKRLVSAVPTSVEGVEDTSTYWQGVRQDSFKEITRPLIKGTPAEQHYSRERNAHLSGARFHHKKSLQLRQRLLEQGFIQDWKFKPKPTDKCDARIAKQYDPKFTLKFKDRKGKTWDGWDEVKKAT